MRKLLKSKDGVVTIEIAIILALFVLPVGLAISKLAPIAINWVQVTAANLKTNSDLQAQNNELLRQLLEKQNGSTTNSQEPTTNTTDPTAGCDPTPGATNHC